MQNPFFGFPENGFFCGSQVGSPKKMQNRRISVSSPYSRTAETDFGERKSEYDKKCFLLTYTILYGIIYNNILLQKVVKWK